MAATTHDPVETLTVRRWDGEAWVADSAAAPAVASTVPPPRLRLATLNILADCFPWFVKLATPPAERIAAAVDCIACCDADVLGLNEVTAGILGTLLADPRIRAAYRTTHVPGDIPDGKDCCVVLSKLPVEGAWHYPAVSEFAKGPIGSVRQRFPVVVSVGGILIASVHPIAWQRAETRRLRGEQIASIVAALRARGRPFAVMGDMNLHDPAEDRAVVANDLLDVWAETHPAGVRAAAPGYREEEAGFTFDARVNTMIPRYIPGETRRMRLDRILVSRGFPLRPAGPCRLWAHEPVNAKREVFVSDHFGLVVDLAADPPVDGAGNCGWQGSADVRALLEQNGEDVPLPNPFSALRFGMSLIGHSFFLAKRAARL